MIFRGEVVLEPYLWQLCGYGQYILCDTVKTYMKKFGTEGQKTRRAQERPGLPGSGVFYLIFLLHVGQCRFLFLEVDAHIPILCVQVRDYQFASMDDLCYHRLFTLELDLGHCKRYDERQKISTLLRSGRMITIPQRSLLISTGLDNFHLFGHPTPPIGCMFIIFEKNVSLCTYQRHTQILLRRNTLSRSWLKQPLGRSHQSPPRPNTSAFHSLHKASLLDYQ